MGGVAWIKEPLCNVLLEMIIEGTGLTRVLMSSVHCIHPLESCCGEMCCAVIPK